MSGGVGGVLGPKGLNKRLLKEFADAQSDPMKRVGIYFSFNEANIMKTKAMIFGPEDTPYAHCPLVFEIQFGTTYPFDPPKVTILTSDGVTRFHPNLYIDGKVCLSILGTWSGPKWSPIMTVSTLLSSIQSLLEKNPIVNEPGYEKLTLEGSERARNYAELVRYRLLLLTIKDYIAWKRADTPVAWRCFEDVIEDRKDALLEKYREALTVGEREGEKELKDVPYTMRGRTNWSSLRAMLQNSASPV